MGYVGSIHRNKQFWAKPNEFYPEHFLNENGLLRKNVQGLIPFSTGTKQVQGFVEMYYSRRFYLKGKRACIGENLARVELFIFVTYFFKKFEFTLCENPKVSLNGDPRSGIVRWPSPYKVVLKSR